MARVTRAYNMPHKQVDNSCDTSLESRIRLWAGNSWQCIEVPVKSQLCTAIPLWRYNCTLSCGGGSTLTIICSFVSINNPPTLEYISSNRTVHSPAQESRIKVIKAYRMGCCALCCNHAQTLDIKKSKYGPNQGGSGERIE